MSTIVFLVFGYSASDNSEIKETDKCEIDSTYWIPTEEDIRYQDSMYQIINKTRLDVDTIRVQMKDILYKLDKLTYPDGTYDSIRIPIKGDTVHVKATMYHPVEAQCDSDPLITADGSKIDPYNVSDWNWIAVSRDLLVSGGGCLNYGDSVYVVAGHKTGWYVVHDTMNKRWTKRIDFLESLGTEAYRYNEAELIINS